MSKKILLVEDEAHLAFTLNLNLLAEGYHVIHADNGRSALDAFQEDPHGISAVLLDLMLPQVDGFEVAKQIRRQNRAVAILMLTARAHEEDRLAGLSLGVDDYITKPFHLKELLLRLGRAVTRTQFYGDDVSQGGEAFLVHGPLSLERSHLKLQVGPKHYDLTALEADVLYEFMSHPGQVLSREYLLQKVWGVSQHMETRTVDNFISRLRKLFESQPLQSVHLLSVRGRGYKLEVHGLENA